MDDCSDADDSMDGPSLSSSTKGDDDARRHARAQHNALERRRRDNIKAMYGCLEGKVAKGGEKLSRAAILKKSIETITQKSQKYNEKQARIAELRQLNQRLCKETEILRARKKEVESTQIEETQVIQQRIAKGDTE